MVVGEIVPVFVNLGDLLQASRHPLQAGLLLCQLLLNRLLLG